MPNSSSPRGRESRIRNWFRSKPSQADREREAFLQTLSLIAQSFSAAQASTHEAVIQLAKASEAQAHAMREHLALFSISDLPTSRVMRDADEFNNELKRAGYPVEAEPNEQLSWVLRASARDE